MFTRLPASAQQSRSPQKALAFGGLRPWEIWVSQNQVVNREIIDWTGYEPWAIGFARNKFEKVERLFDGLSWLTIGVLGPIMLDKVFNRRWTQSLMAQNENKAHFLSIQALKARLPQVKNVRFKPIGLAFELLDKAGFEGRFKPGSKALEQLKDYGLKSLPQKLAEKLLKYKLLILWVDLLLMASKGQIFSWGKNILTQKLSGKKGFVGEFQYASDDYLKLKSAEQEKTKKRNMLLSLGIGYGSACALPLILWNLLRAKNPPNFIQQIKKIIPAFNYFDSIYMSKWVIGWSSFFNWTLAGSFSARDDSERRETWVRTIATDFFFLIGDDIFAALMGKGLEGYYKDRLKGIKLVKKGRLGLPHAISPAEFQKTMQQMGLTKNKAAQDLAANLVRVNFWGGILSTALGLGITVTLLNNWYTHKKVLEEQRELEKKGLIKAKNKPQPRAIPMRTPRWPIPASPLLIKNTQQHLRQQAM